MHRPLPPPASTETLEARVRRVTGSRQAITRERVQSLWSGYGEVVRMDLDMGPVVVKCVEPPTSRGGDRSPASHRSHQRKLRSYSVEMQWYRRYAGHCVVAPRAPRALATEAAEQKFLFVLEDLDAAGYRHRHAILHPAQVRACLRWLAQFHATFLGAAPDGLWPVGTYWHLATRPDELAALRDPALQSAAPLLDQMLEACMFKTFVHGDAKAANFCFPEDPCADVAAVDFQYVGGGCGMKDVAYFLHSILDEGMPEAQIDELVEDYLDSLSKAIHERAPQIDAAAVVAEWHWLYPVAWADFMRFMEGWAGGRWGSDTYGHRMIETALQRVP